MPSSKWQRSTVLETVAKNTDLSKLYICLNFIEGTILSEIILLQWPSCLRCSSSALQLVLISSNPTGCLKIYHSQQCCLSSGSHKKSLCTYSQCCHRSNACHWCGMRCTLISWFAQPFFGVVAIDGWSSYFALLDSAGLNRTGCLNI